jgi:maltose alpha-D-glucosyltransferase/alpha-amylase
LRSLAERAFAAIAHDRSDEARAALTLRERIARIIDDAPLEGTRVLRVHGDFHLGHVLVTEGDVLIIDPGIGEANRPPPQRRRKTSPFADVATLIRSLDEVTAVAAFDISTDPSEDPARFVPILRESVRAAATTFVRAYLARARELALVDVEGDTLRALVHVYLVRAICEAIVYDAHSRRARPRDLYVELTRIFERSDVAQ